MEEMNRDRWAEGERAEPPGARCKVEGGGQRETSEKMVAVGKGRGRDRKRRKCSTGTGRGKEKDCWRITAFYISRFRF